MVPIEIAKKLKKIGFNEPCLLENVETHSEDYSFINFEEEMCSDVSVMLEDVIFVRNQFLEDNIGIYKDLILKTAIPTWEQVFEWFREKGLFHSIHISEDLLHRVKFFEAEIRDKNADIICIISKLTYEEARKALINKLIEIYETNINI